MWIQYRPQEPIPEYLLTKNCLNVLGADGPALFCWIKYRKNEPIPQQLLCNIVDKQVTTPFTDFQF